MPSNGAAEPAKGIVRVTCAGEATEETLRRIDAALGAHPDAADLRFARACLLEELGRATQARIEYMAVLQRDGRHLGALTNLAIMYYATNRHAEARELFAYCARHHPDDPLAQRNLAAVRRGG